MSVETVNDVVLLALPADWGDTKPTWTLRWDTEVAPTLRGYEGRGGLRRTPRPTLAYTVQPLRVKARARHEESLKAALAAGRCAVPVFGRAAWLAADQVAGDTRLALEPGGWPFAVGDYVLVYDAAEAHAVGRVTAVDGPEVFLDQPLPATGVFPAGTPVYPLLFGRPTMSEADVTARNGEIASFPVEVLGDRYDALLRGAPVAVPPTCEGRPVFPLTVDWSQDVTRRFVYDQRTRDLGFGAGVQEPEAAFPAEQVEFGVHVKTGDDLRVLERFFCDLYGRLRGFWLPSPQWALDIVAADTEGTLLVRNVGLAESFAGDADLHLWLRPEDQPDVIGFPVKVTAVAAVDNKTERVTLEVPFPPGIAPDAGWTVQRLLYVRLTDDEVVMEFLTNDRATAVIRVYELPVEYASVERGERPAFLYHFWRQDGVGRREWRFTSFDERVYAGTAGHQDAWEPAPIAHGEMENGTDGSREKLEITSWKQAGNPLSAWIPYAPPYEMNVEVLEVDLGAPDPTATTLLFSGLVERVSPKGKLLTADCTTRVDRLGAQLPRFFLQTGCNYDLYGVCCRVPRADYTVGTSVVSSDGLTLLLQGGGAGDRPADWFAFGDASLPADADGVAGVRAIVRSSPVGGDQVAITLNAPPSTPPAVGAAVQIAAGCDLSADTCKNKFNNLVNFGGHPFVDQNLALKAITAKAGGTGKGGK